MVTLSPGLRLKMNEDMAPGGTSGWRGGGLAMRTLSMIMPFSSG